MYLPSYLGRLALRILEWLSLRSSSLAVLGHPVRCGNVPWKGLYLTRPNGSENQRCSLGVCRTRTWEGKLVTSLSVAQQTVSIDINAGLR